MASPDSPEDSVGVAQYPDEDGIAGQQYADASQYAEEGATQEQYEPAAPSGEPTDPAGEPTVEPEDLPAPPPATIAPPVEELEEPPADLVKPGSTVEHRIELKVAAQLGTATDSPDTPELAPEPADVPTNDMQASGDTPEAPEDTTATEAEAPSETTDAAPGETAVAEAEAPSEAIDEAPETSEAEQPTETNEAQEPSVDEAPEVTQAEQPTETDEEREIQIERLPDTGGPAILPERPVTQLIAVALAAGLLYGGLRRIKG